MIDTLKASHELIENGFSEAQAQSIINIVNNTHDNVATKDDVVTVKQDVVLVRQELALLRQEFVLLKQSIASLRWIVNISLILHAVTISGIIAILIMNA